MNRGTSARKFADIIDMQSYESGYATGYTEGLDCGYESGYHQCKKEYRMKMIDRKNKKIEAKKHRLYFLKQKMIGVLFLLFTVWAVKVLDGDATIALLTVPISLVLIFSKEKYWMDRYYFECEEKERNEYIAQKKKKR